MGPLEFDLNHIAKRALRAGALSLAVIGLTTGLAQTASAEGATAFNVTASLTTHDAASGRNIVTGLDPVNRQAAGVGPTYNKGANTGPFSQTLLLTAGGLPVPALTVNAANLRSHVSGISGIAATSSEADATATGLDLRLAQYPRASEGAVKVPYLHITADTLKETGTYTRSFVKKNGTTVAASGEVKGLTISGSLIGDKVIKFSGKPTGNQVVFDSPTVTITLNQSISAALISCFPDCVVTPYYIDTSALVISLKKADLDGNKVTGTITIGAGNAGGATHF